MSKRIECSIFLISESEIVRADYGGKSAQHLIDFQRQEKDPTLKTADALRLVVDAKKKNIGRRAFVFETSVWSQIVSVPMRSIEDVQPDELQNALKFEVETLSGIDAINASLGITRLNSDDPTVATFWVNVVASDQFDVITELLKSRGAKWIGVAHPLGFSVDSFLTPKNKKTVELWESVAASFDQRRPLNVVGRTGRWTEQLNFASPEDAVENALIIAQHGSYLSDWKSSEQYVDLSEEAPLKSWLQAAARRAIAGIGDFPLVKTSDQVASTSVLSSTFYRVAAAALVGLFCLWHWNWLDSSEQKVELETKKLLQPETDKRNFDSQLAQVLEQRSKLEQDANETQLKIKKLEFLFEFQTERLGELLALLKKHRTPDLVINRIDPHENGIVVAGLSLNGTSAPELAKRLRVDARPLGWQIHPPTQNGEKKMVSGGPWQFSILLEDVGPGSPIVGASKQDKPARVNST